MTAQEHRIYPNLYKDSVALMATSAALIKIAGIDAASVVMATDANRENLRVAGLSDEPSAGPNDLLVAVRGDTQACVDALALADTLLADQPTAREAGAERAPVPTSVGTAFAQDPSATLALISVPGPYAAAEALKALQLGVNVMIFSDNVPVAEEVELKRYAEAHKLLVMGPDCGTALVNGIPLGFANVVRSGRTGVVGASGTGMQEITSRLHQRGGGVSQALGTGGHDVSAEVGGISTLHALRALDEDDATEVIVLVSKPPAESVATAVLEAARSMATPVVVMFVGADTAAYDQHGVHLATTLAEAADAALAIAAGESIEPATAVLAPEALALLDEAAGRLAASQRHLRGVFSGGTFCYEAQLLCRAHGIHASSNTPITGNAALADVWTSAGDTIIDMGDDVFTQGRPHPMIDPTLRNERIRAEIDDPSTAVLLFDVVLGYGAATDPVSTLLEVLAQAGRRATDAGRSVVVIGHVCGTDADPQDRSAVITQLREAGVLVADSNAHAARMAAAVVSALAPSGKK